MLEYFENIDQQLFLFINALHNPFWDKFMGFVSGKWEWTPLYLVLLFFVIKSEKKHWWLAILGIITLIFITDQTSVHLFKEVFKRYRPCHNMDIKAFIHLVNNHCGGTYGFVSSHAANSFALAGFLSFVFKKKQATWLLLFWATIVSYSRIYLGVHYPADVFFGGLLGFLTSYIVYKVYKKTQPCFIQIQDAI